ncbi:hypothetical protein [Aquabacterium sp.]|uniref:hypothetical protein n=1 Tax=Aquabacterium sp. TaxID=1872578 RepID=UPI0040379FBC
MEARLKNALIGAGLGVTTDVAFLAVKGLKNYLGGPGVANKVLDAFDKAKAVDAATPKVEAKAAEAATRPAPTLAENIAAMSDRRATAAQRKAAGKGPARLEPLPKTTETAEGAAQRTPELEAANAARETLPDAQRVGQNRTDAELAFSDPVHAKQLDQWEKIAAHADTVRAAEEASAKQGALGSLTGLLKKVAGEKPTPKTRIALEGELPLIGREGDPIVHSLDSDVEQVMGPLREATGTPHVLPQESLEAVKAHVALQDETIQALRKTLNEGKTNGRVFSDEAREFLRDLAEQRVVKPQGTPEEISKSLFDMVRSKDALIAKAAKAINPDGTLNLPKGPSGITSPSGLVKLLVHADPKGAAVAAAGGVAGASGLAGAEDGSGEHGFSASSAVATALAAYASYKLAKFGGRKAFEFAKGLKPMDPLATSLSQPELRGLTAEPIQPTAKVLISKPRVDEFVKAAMDGKLDDLAQRVDVSDFNFERMNTPDATKKWLDAFTAHAETELTKAKRGTQTLGDIEDRARDIGLTQGDVKRLYGDVQNLSEKFTAMRMALVASATHARKVIEYAVENASAEAILAARQAEMRHATLHTYMKGTQTEIARAMSAMRIVVGEADTMKADMHVMLEGLGGYDANIAHLARMRDLAGDPLKLAQVSAKTSLARSADGLFEMFLGGILSGAASQARNVAGNTATLLTSIIERQAAVGIGQAKRLIGGGEEAMAQREVMAYTGSLIDGFKASLSVTTAGRASIASATKKFLSGNYDAAIGELARNQDELGGFWTSLLLGEGKAEGLHIDPFAHNKLNAPNMPKLSSQYLGGAEREVFGMSTEGSLGKAIDYFGAAVRTPLRALKAADDAFKAAIYHGELNALAYREAVRQGKEGTELAKLSQDLVDRPTPEMRELAMEAAKKGTFSGDLNANFKWMVTARNTPGVRWILPIVSTPLNAIGWVGERTPGIRRMSDAIQADIAAGGIRADQANARALTAGMIVATAYMAAASGILNGYEDRKRSAENLSGPKMYSVAVGDGTYVQISSLSGVGTLLGIAADLHQITAKHPEYDAGAAFGALMTSMYNNIGSQTMLAGWSDFTDALSSAAQGGDMTKFSTWMKGLTSSVVTPFSGMFRSMAHVDDPYAKEIWTLSDAIKAKLPFFSKDVPNRVDALGNDVSVSLSPLDVSKDSEDPAARELRRLNVDLQGASRHMPVGQGMPNIDLTPAQFYRLKKIHGGIFKEQLNGLIDNPAWANVSEEKGESLEYKSDKERLIKLLHAQSGEAARAHLLQEFPELQDKMTQIIQGRPN